MNQNSASLVAKVWNYAHVLRDQGISYGDYVEQISYLLFLKMDHEKAELLGEDSTLPAAWRWDKLQQAKDGNALEEQYRKTLDALGRQPGLVGSIFGKAQNKLSDPAKLKRVVSMIDKETWVGLDTDVKGDIYEGLLERNAAEVKSGAGQYFTPRPIIDAIVSVMNPRIGETICDPACGTGGFLLSAYTHMKGQSQDREQQRQLREHSLFGFDLVPEVVRLCSMNMYLHNIGGRNSPVGRRDSLAKDSGERYDLILTNPPFGKKSSFKVVGEDGSIDTERENYERDDFTYTTSNKQLNFLQHIMTILKGHGRAAVVLPDNVLFEAGNAAEGIRKRLLQKFDFHTLLRLPTGIFYAQGVKANVLFFDKKPASSTPQTSKLWVYDLRTNQRFTPKTNPLQSGHLDEFVACFNSGHIRERQETERFKAYSYTELLQRDKLNLDLFWLRDDSLEDMDKLPEPAVIAEQIVENLRAALEQFSNVEAALTTNTPSTG